MTLWRRMFTEEVMDDIYIYIYAFIRRFYPKRLTVHSGYTFVLLDELFLLYLPQLFLNSEYSEWEQRTCIVKAKLSSKSLSTIKKHVIFFPNTLLGCGGLRGVWGGGSQCGGRAEPIPKYGSPEGGVGRW